MAWTNDGLYKKFGTEKTVVNPVGEYRTDGPKRMVEIRFSYTDLPTVAAGSTIITRDFALPVGCSIEAVEIYTSVDVDSTSDDLTLNVGWIDQDASSNADVDALVVAATQTELNTGGTNIAGWVGAEVNGAELTTSKYLTWEVDNHAMSAGQGAIRIYYSVI